MDSAEVAEKKKKKNRWTFCGQGTKISRETSVSDFQMIFPKLLYFLRATFFFQYF